MKVHHLEFWDEGGRLGGFVRLAIAGRTAEVWAYLAGTGRALLAVREEEVAAPRSGLEIRASGLWLALHCETPGEHWSVGLEAFAVALDDPEDALRGERGDLVAFGLDLEWEGPDDALNVVHGEVLVGEEVIVFEGTGRRQAVSVDPGYPAPDGHRVLIPRPDGTTIERILTPTGWLERLRPPGPPALNA